MASSTRMAINGFGRIGRAAFRIARNTKGIEIAAINDITEAKILAHLLKYDSVYRTLAADVSAVNGALVVAGKRYPVTAIKDPAQLPWKKMKVATVLECTGRFTNRESAGAHLTAGAKRVVISAPGKDGQTPTVVLGTSATAASLRSRRLPSVVSNASCTTNCIAPVMQVLQDSFGVAKAMMTTVHSYTADQTLVDGPHRDLRRARAAAVNMVPTSTGAAIATTAVVPALHHRFDGISIRVPTICVSLADITAVLKRDATIHQVNAAFQRATQQPAYRSVLGVSDRPLVSSDFLGDPRSAIVDLEFTRVVDGNLVKVLAWYDNEWAYANRLVELALAISR